VRFLNQGTPEPDPVTRPFGQACGLLIGGCDKTVPAQLMGAAAANVPAIQLVTGAG
jgi:hypothetical protein